MSARSVDGCENILRRAIDVAIEIELRGNLRRAEAADGGKLRQARNLRELGLKGVATDEAIVSGEAPGSCAETEIVGKSTCGKGARGSMG